MLVAAFDELHCLSNIGYITMKTYRMYMSILSIVSIADQES
jgi:hypothetical protein